MKLISQRAAHKLQAEIVRIQAEYEDRCLVLEKAERELAKLTAYIDQEKFNWRLDRERANGAEAELAEHKEYTEELESRGAILHEKVCEYKAKLAEVQPTKAAIHLHLELAELRDAVAWYFECDELYRYDREYGFVVGWAYMEFMETVQGSVQQLREMARGEDGAG